MNAPEFLLYAGATAAAVAICLRFTTRPRWLLLLALSCAVTLAAGFAAERAATTEQERLRAMLEGFAPTYAVVLERAGHARITPDTPRDDPLYLEMIALQNQWLAANPAVMDIYTFRKGRDGNVLLIVDSETDYDRNGVYDGETEQRTPIGLEWGPTTQPLGNAFAGNYSFEKDEHEDQWGTWVSAYVPMRDRTGAVEAVLGVDFPVTEWRRAASRARWFTLAQFAVVQLVLIGASLWVAAAAAESERRRAHAAALQEGLLRAQAADRAKSEFLAAMSHELRTPLNGVLGMSEILRGLPLDPEPRRVAETIHRSGELLLGVINDILDYSKLDAGRATVESAPFDLERCLEDVAELMAATAERKGLELVLAIDPQLPRSLMGDAHRLRQIVVNLVGNAIKFTDAGEVTLGAHGVAAQGASPAQAWIELAVRDTGCGIPPEAGSAIFEPFTQADGSITRRHGGTGLGLAISHRLAVLMGGTLDYTSRVGEGTEFRLRIPFPRAPLPAADAAAAPLAGASVLLIDDNPHALAALAAQVRSFGLGCETASGAAEALALLGRDASRFGAAVVDRYLPEMGEGEFLRRLRSEAGAPGLPVLLLTGTVDADDTALPADGATARLARPVRRLALRASLERVLGTPVATPGEASPAAPSPAPVSGTRVLLAEDNEVNVLVARAMLERAGCTVEAVPDGRAAVDAWRAGRFDVVLMDCQMPVMDGYSAAREIRTIEAGEPARGRTPIIALTAHALAEHRQRSLDSGMDDHLSKPFGFEELQQTVAQWAVRSPAALATTA